MIMLSDHDAKQVPSKSRSSSFSDMTWLTNKVAAKKYYKPLFEGDVGGGPSEGNRKTNMHNGMMARSGDADLEVKKYIKEQHTCGCRSI